MIRSRSFLGPMGRKGLEGEVLKGKSEATNSFPGILRGFASEADASSGPGGDHPDPIEVHPLRHARFDQVDALTCWAAAPALAHRIETSPLEPGGR